jgi:uncharacterized protein YjiS (DUF1127 family)
MTMCAQDHSRDFITVPKGATLRARIVQSLYGQMVAWKNRRAFYRLSQFSDYELSDIGLTRGDLFSVTHDRFVSDPTTRLSKLVDGNCALSKRGSV